MEVVMEIMELDHMGIAAVIKDSLAEDENKNKII